MDVNGVHRGGGTGRGATAGAERSANRQQMLRCVTRQRVMNPQVNGTAWGSRNMSSNSNTGSSLQINLTGEGADIFIQSVWQMRDFRLGAITKMI